MKKKTKWWLCLAPMYIFTLLFILGPIIYMFVVSFATNKRSARLFTWTFTLENFARMLDPVYVDCFVQSFKLAFSTTILVVLIGYPFGYFMAKLSAKGEKNHDVSDHGAVLDKFSAKTVWLDHHTSGKGAV